MTRYPLPSQLHLVTIFLRIRVLPRPSWDEQIALHCGANTQLAREVRALLEDDHRFGQLHLCEGMLIGERYRLETELGGGSSGDVWRALDTKIPERRVAIKLLHPQGEGDRGLLRACREASAASQVVSDHVARIEDVGLCEASGAYLVMELCAEPVHGALVNARSMAATPPRSLREALRWSIQVARGVQALHEQGVFHLDLKPDNVLIRPRSRRAQVVDFGLARHSEAGPGDAAAAGSDAHALTEPLESPRYQGPQGTLCFMAPEQARGLRSDLDPEVPNDYEVLSRVDVYGIGAILYHLLAGHPPFVDIAEDLQPATLLRLMRTSRPTPLSSPGKGPRHFHVPQRVARIVDTAMAPDPERRYSSSATLADDLEAYLDNRSTSLDGGPSMASAFRWALRHKQVLAPLVPVLALVALLAGRYATDLQLDRVESFIASARATADRLGAEQASKVARASARAAEQRAVQATKQVVATRQALRVEKLNAQAAERRATLANRRLVAAREQRTSTTTPTPTEPVPVTKAGPEPDDTRGPAPKSARPPAQDRAEPSAAKARASRPPPAAVDPQPPKQDQFVHAVRRNAEAVWEVRELSATGEVTGLCLPIDGTEAVRCRRLAQFSAADRRLLRETMRLRAGTERRSLIRSQSGEIVRKCVGTLAVTGSHMRRAACEDL